MCDSIDAIDPDLREAAMKTIDEMLNLALLTPDEHQQISSWIAQADTPDEIITDPGNAKGSLADAVEQLWRDAIQATDEQ